MGSQLAISAWPWMVSGDAGSQSSEALFWVSPRSFIDWKNWSGFSARERSSLIPKESPARAAPAVSASAKQSKPVRPRILFIVLLVVVDPPRSLSRPAAGVVTFALNDRLPARRLESRL